MTRQQPTCIELTEQSTECLPAAAIENAWGRALYERFQRYVDVEAPTFLNDNQWRLTAKGWVGYIPVAREFVVALRPKVPVGNLFRMLEWAYQLRSFEIPGDLVGCQSIEEFYEQLASVLARRVTDRARRGLYRAYVPIHERLPYARGRLDISLAIRTPWEARLPWHYEEHTADIEDNRILAWTLFCIARGGLCTERVLPTVRRAYRALQGAVCTEPVCAGACLGRLYHRLNEDYQPLHALCRFFLEHSGPRHEAGDRRMLPFLVNMDRLFELFVAEWLRANLPAGISLRAQERVSLDPNTGLHFSIDLVLYDQVSRMPCCVLDTKYKTGSGPDPDDLKQAIAYAKTRDCHDAVLVYPAALSHPLDRAFGDIRVRTLPFDVGGDLAAAGREFVDALFPATPADSRPLAHPQLAPDGPPSPRA